MIRSRAAFLICAVLMAAGVERRASAQLPFPLLGEGEHKSKPGTSRAEDEDDEEGETADSPEPDGHKDYARPKPRALPEGPPQVLEGVVAVVPFKGIVNPGMGEFVVSSIERAARERAQAVLIELDTPGGLVSSTERIIQGMLAAKLPVIVHVTPSGAHAASAGTFITLAAHVAAMAPATRLGAAHPVSGSGKDIEAEGGKRMGKKVENDLVALVEGIAKERNRNVAWATDAVRNSVSINQERALELGVIDLIARDRTELLEKLHGTQLMIGPRKVELNTRGATIVEYKPSIRQWLMNLLANPGVAMVLGVLGVIGIMIEVYHPGVIAPGLMGILCIICSLMAVEQLPIDVGAAILVLAGMGLLVAEIYTSTYGALALLGAVGLTIGLLLLVDTKNPGYLVDESFSLQLSDIIPIVVLILVLIAYLSYFVVRKKKGRSVTGTEGLIGSVGLVLKPVGPDGGTIFISGEYWRARAAESIPEKEEVEVVRVDGLELEVRRKMSGSGSGR